MSAKKTPSFITSVCNWANNVDSFVCHLKTGDVVTSQLEFPESSAPCLEEADAVAEAQTCGSASATGVLRRATAHRLTLDSSPEQPGIPSEDILQVHDKDQTANWMHSDCNNFESFPSKCSSACSASLAASIEHDVESDGSHCSSCSSIRSSSTHSHRISSSSAQSGHVSPDNAVRQNNSFISCHSGHSNSSPQTGRVSLDDAASQNHSLEASPVGPLKIFHGLVLLLRHEFLKYAF